MNARDKVLEAQAEIINKLSGCEEAISRLYLTYSEKLSATHDFWRDLSEKEKGHANVLKTMHKQLEHGNIFYNMGRFDTTEMTTFMDYINDAITYAKMHIITPKDAISVALVVESSVLDAHFYDIVKSDAPEYRIIAQRLSGDTNDHVKAVQDMLLKIQQN